MKDALVAAEDRTFWTNRGISVPGMVRAAWNIVRGGDIQSGSTITQQYIKTLYLTSAQTPSRKLKELVLSVKMTNSMSKDEILQGYLNTVYFGRGAYGIEAAAQAYFNIDAASLDVQQAAVLTSLVRGPSLYDPANPANLTRLTQRYDYVLDSMVTMGTLTQADDDQYKDHLPDFPDVPTSQRYGGPTGFLMNMVQTELEQNGFTDDQIQGGGLTIITTFDATMQAAAVQAAQDYTNIAATKARPQQDPSQLHAAVASVDVGTGDVLAVYGGPDFVTNSRNWATTRRSVGSTFKPFAFIAGERNGASLSTPLTGNPITVNGQTINNESHIKYGTVTLLKAMQESINTAFVDLVQQIPDGPNQVIQAAQDCGLTPDPSGSWQAVPVIPLGVAEVSPLDMAGAYATIANDGVSVANHVVAEVKDSTGSVIYQAKPAPKQTVELGIAQDLTYALQSVVDVGTGTAAKALGYPSAGKTGTATYTPTGGSQYVSAAWFVGFTKQISTAVMYVVGDDGMGSVDAYAPAGSSTFYGAVYPAQTWAEYMKTAMNGLPKVQFDQPADVNQPSSAPPSTDTPTDTPTEEATAPATVEVPTTAPPTTSAPPATVAPPPVTTTKPTSTTQPPETTSGSPTVSPT
ncbi:MAG: penicillin-binding protein [Micrococcales bacterium]|nr:penicillin-binding protein [Micrococcales bacterium]